MSDCILMPRASMGPVSFNTGNFRTGEGPICGRDASMGPVSFNTGNGRQALDFDGVDDASMGPVSFNTGNSSISCGV